MEVEVFAVDSSMLCGQPWIQTKMSCCQELHIQPDCTFFAGFWNS
jgi:hypothetical protein